ncbi:MAG: glycosyl hydrolase family 65 protein, partial [Candidatus Thermoplasmatota archaeon]|nr:glycosyl hydrolase family 65 protein [Candidatus Thermoplasmatota archaeon]
ESAIDLKPVPTLPENWTGITYKGIKWQGHLVNVALESKQAKITVTSDNSQIQEQSAPVNVVIWGHAFDAKLNHTYSITLDGKVNDLSEKANDFGVPGFGIAMSFAAVALAIALARRRSVE